MDHETLRRRLVQAIADPGHWTPRGDNYEESIPSWSARAAILALEQIANDETHTTTLDGDGVVILENKTGQPVAVLLSVERAGRLNQQLVDAQIDRDLLPPLAADAPCPKPEMAGRADRCGQYQFPKMCSGTFCRYV